MAEMLLKDMGVEPTDERDLTNDSKFHRNAYQWSHVVPLLTCKNARRKPNSAAART